MPRSKLSISKRKQPKQQRSVSLVHSILEASAQILSKESWQKLSTNVVAEKAGVSIGSLYQYFPNKEALLATLMEKSTGIINASLAKVMARLEGKSKAEIISELVDFALREFLSERKLTREIYSNLMAYGHHKITYGSRRQAVELLAQKLATMDGKLEEIEDYRFRCFVAVNAGMGVVHTLLYDDEQVYDRETLARELKILLGNYLGA